MICPEIRDLRLDHKSQRALDDIKKKVNLGKLGAAVTGGSVIAQIFYRSNSAQVTYNIAQTDWKLLAVAMNAWPAISHKVVRDIAIFQVMDHQHDPAQRRFWEAIANGCRP